jgi:hypothetical protein
MQKAAFFWAAFLFNASHFIFRMKTQNSGKGTIVHQGFRYRRERFGSLKPI